MISSDQPLISDNERYAIDNIPKDFMSENCKKIVKNLLHQAVETNEKYKKLSQEHDFIKEKNCDLRLLQGQKERQGEPITHITVDDPLSEDQKDSVVWENEGTSIIKFADTLHDAMRKVATIAEENRILKEENNQLAQSSLFTPIKKESPPIQENPSPTISYSTGSPSSSSQETPSPAPQEELPTPFKMPEYFERGSLEKLKEEHLESQTRRKLGLEPAKTEKLKKPSAEKPEADQWIKDFKKVLEGRLNAATFSNKQLVANYLNRYIENKKSFIKTNVLVDSEVKSLNIAISYLTGDKTDITADALEKIFSAIEDINK
jgi:hypothetical protein